MYLSPCFILKKFWKFSNDPPCCSLNTVSTLTMQYCNLGQTRDLYNCITYYLICHDVCVTMLYKYQEKTHFLPITSSCLSGKRSHTAGSHAPINFSHWINERGQRKQRTNCTKNIKSLSLLFRTWTWTHVDDWRYQYHRDFVASLIPL